MTPERSFVSQFIGQTILVTTENWFHAPDGRQYRAVFGKLKSVRTAECSLGIKPNGKSTNWYMEVGNMMIAGCQLHYVIRTDSFNRGAFIENSYHEGRATLIERVCAIYDAECT